MNYIKLEHDLRVAAEALHSGLLEEAADAIDELTATITEERDARDREITRASLDANETILHMCRCIRTALEELDMHTERDQRDRDHMLTWVGRIERTRLDELTH